MGQNAAGFGAQPAPLTEEEKMEEDYKDQKSLKDSVMSVGSTISEKFKAWKDKLFPKGKKKAGVKKEDDKNKADVPPPPPQAFESQWVSAMKWAQAKCKTKGVAWKRCKRGVLNEIKRK